MNPFQVPKVISRHVYKALISMQSTDTQVLTEEEIVGEVKKTTRRNKPTPNVDNAVHLALLKMVELGVIGTAGESSYVLHKSLRRRVLGLKSRPVQSRTRESTSRGRCSTSGVKRGRVTKPVVSSRRSRAKSNLICNECVSDIYHFRDAHKLSQLLRSSSINLVTPMESCIEDTPVVVNDAESNQDAASVEAMASNVASNEDVADKSMEDDTN